MIRPVSLYLTRFGEEPEPDFSAPGAFQPEPAPLRAVEIGDLSEEARETLLAQARAEAKAEYDAALAEMRAAHEAQLERERSDFDGRLVIERRDWAAEEGARLGQEFSRVIEEVAERLENSVAEILEPFVAEKIKERMLSDFVAKLRLLLADRKHPLVQLSGPMDLLESVRARLDGADVATTIAEVGGVDVKARLDQTVIETRLEEWIEEFGAEAAA